jgi:tRNA modification GTPase
MAEPTFVACLTPAGKGAVATLAVRGLRAWPATRVLFRPRHGSLPEVPSSDRTWLGQLGDDVRDEVLLAVKRIEPVVWLEVHCHGGRAVIRLIEELYVAHGVEACAWQELERRTNGPDWRIAAQEMLVQASTARTAAILLDQYAGAFHEAMEAIRIGPPDAARERRERLIQLVPLGRHLVQPWSVVIGGAPNVGKSSLVNALAGYTRSVVAPSAGTTRDVVTTVIAIDGWPVELSDTAGLRAAAEEIESEGVARARAAAAAADLRLWVLDGAADPVLPDDGGPWRLVINKIDLSATWDWSRMSEAMRVSAHTGAGVPELCAAISGWLVPAPPVPGEAVPFSADDCDRVLQSGASS